MANMRESYGASALHRSDLHADPFEQFHAWFREACESQIPEPNAMSLSTPGLDGIPTSRTVLLKDLDQRGFTFFTSYESRKAKEIEAHPGASLLFLWKELQRQVHVKGRVEKVSLDISESYFYSRPYESRIGAWASIQSLVIPDRGWLEEREKQIRSRFPNTGEPGCVPIPDTWGGYRVLPASIEFWQGGPARLHDRFVYSKSDSGEWIIERWSP